MWLFPIKWLNDQCYDNLNQMGICYTRLKCTVIGGAYSGICALGLGACCVVAKSCNKQTSDKVVYFKNPGYPRFDTGANICTMTLQIRDPDVCQVRLDFIDFDLDQPTLGDCLGDKFRVSSSGGTGQIPMLCGRNTNQHVYVHVPNGGSATRTVIIIFDTNSIGDYRWQIKMTQIDCRPGRLPGVYPPAPNGCLQYHTEPTKVIESFNYGNQYLNNLDYGVCVERAPNTCRVTYRVVGDREWSLDSAQAAKDRSAVGDQQCAGDYLLIAGGSETGDPPTADRYCGGRFNWLPGAVTDAPVVSKANGMIALRFHSDTFQDPAFARGFRVRYEQSSTGLKISRNTNVSDIDNYEQRYSNA
ncbi:unnamed protein product [Medioppia subpectinata]|uniref:CUB domain-containing protein n=1 Tax=Medioppia subpectinata TaxID=1979941 RepID=A0A7R9KQA7_9ACAR|nr:unnamed protein product [Medioppia subpectinata]CAG2106678.1 unnamed protein product [Medioppia subpectinata]